MLIRRYGFSLTLATMLLSVMVAGCGSARRGEPVAGSMPITSSDIKQGRAVFMKHCDQCHPGGEAGLGPALNNKPLPKFLMRFQVRQGFGAMPAFSEREISEEELDHVLAYLKALKGHGKPS